MSMQTAYARAESKGWLVWIALWVVYIVWGSTYLAIRVVVETIPPLVGMGARFVLAGVIMYAILRWRLGRERVRITRRQLGGSAVIGGLLLLGGNGLVAVAEQDVPSGLAALVIASVPLWVILLRTTVGDRVSRSTLLSVFVGFIGVGILLLPGERPGGASISGMLLIVAAAALWALGSFLSKRISLPSDPLVSTAFQMLTGGLILATAGGLTGELGDLDPSAFSVGSVGALVYLVFIGSLLAFTAYTWLLQNAPISKVATYAYVNPVIAIFLGWLILSEEITPTVFIGAAVIVASVAAVVRRESGQRPAVEGEATPAGGDVLEPSRA